MSVMLYLPSEFRNVENIADIFIQFQPAEIESDSDNTSHSLLWNWITSTN